MRLSATRPLDAAESERDQRRRRLAELQQREALRLAKQAALPELPREDVHLLRFGYAEARGVTYRLVRGELGDLRYSPASAYYLADDDRPVFLERTR